MYAVLEDGAKQYRVSEGQLVTLDYREDKPGTRLELNEVLLYTNDGDTQIGTPTLEGIRVIADVVDHPTKKTYIQKFRRRKNSRKLRGHRQKYMRVKIAHILLPGQDVPPPKQEEAKPKPEEKPEASTTPATEEPSTPESSES